MEFAQVDAAFLDVLGQRPLIGGFRGAREKSGFDRALGGTRNRIARLLLREQLVSVAVGLVAGRCGINLGVRFARSLYHTTGGDTHVWILAVAVVFLTAVASSLLPALRASRANPMQSLKVD